MKKTLLPLILILCLTFSLNVMADTETLRPNAVGDETSISSYYPATGEHWEKVCEVDADDADTWVQNGSPLSWQRDLYDLPASSGSGTINFIKIYFRCHGNSSGTCAMPSLKSNSTVTDGTEIEPATDYTTYSEQWNTNPADDEAWEWSDIDALQIGVSLKASPGWAAVQCTQVYVEVDYTPEAAGWSHKWNTKTISKWNTKEFTKWNDLE